MELQLVKKEDMEVGGSSCCCENKGAGSCAQAHKQNADTDEFGELTEMQEMIDCASSIIKNLFEEGGYKAFDCESIPEIIGEKECKVTYLVKGRNVIEVESGENEETGERFLTTIVLLEEDAQDIIEQLKEIHGDSVFDD